MGAWLLGSGGSCRETMTRSQREKEPQRKLVPGSRALCWCSSTAGRTLSSSFKTTFKSPRHFSVIPCPLFVFLILCLYILMSIGPLFLCV